MRHFLVVSLLIVALPLSRAAAAPYVWVPEQRNLVEDWLKAVGERKPGETLGDLAVRAGRLRLGTPYSDAMQIDAPEALNIELTTLQCVSFVESSLAVARCIYRETPSAECVADEIQSLRYRDGTVHGYASRLHYFNDWLTDNVKRGNITMLTDGADGTPWTQRFDYMTKHTKRYPALSHADVLAAIAADEARLTASEYRVVPKKQVARVERELKTGDVIAFVSSGKPGLMISHTGFVMRAADGSLRILHASSHHQKVVVTRTDLAGYVNARPERQGIMVARPLPPLTQTPTATAVAPH